MVSACDRAGLQFCMPWMGILFSCSCYACHSPCTPSTSLTAPPPPASSPPPLHSPKPSAASFHPPQAVYASFPLHIASDDSSLLDRKLDKLVEEWQWDEVRAYNGGEDSGDGNDG